MYHVYQASQGWELTLAKHQKQEKIWLWQVNNITSVANAISLSTSFFQYSVSVSCNKPYYFYLCLVIIIIIIIILPVFPQTLFFIIIITIFSLCQVVVYGKSWPSAMAHIKHV